MQRIEINKSEYPHFIGCWDIENTSLCKKLIDFFENNLSKQVQGITASGRDLTKKKRIDIKITPNDLKNAKYLVFKDYINELNNCYLDYLLQWPFLKTVLKEIDIESFNIGRYEVGDHFGITHSERTSQNTLHRFFAFMTYLNDVENGGETYFSHFKIKIKPKQGKTLIWPAEWTHAHSGEVVKYGKKYIVTGHMHFPIRN